MQARDTIDETSSWVNFSWKKRKYSFNLREISSQKIFHRLRRWFKPVPTKRLFQISFHLLILFPNFQVSLQSSTAYWSLDSKFFQFETVSALIKVLLSAYIPLVFHLSAFTNHEVSHWILSCTLRILVSKPSTRIQLKPSPTARWFLNFLLSVFSVGFLCSTYLAS